MSTRIYHLIVAALGVLVVAACSSNDGGPTAPRRLDPLQQDQAGSSAATSGFTYNVSSKIADAPSITDPLLRPTITVTAKVRNDRRDSTLVSYGACNVALDAYRTPDRRGTPVWNSWRAEPWEGTSGRGCIAILYQRKLEPGGELTFTYSTRLIELLGDSLPNGRYYLSATIHAGAPGGVVMPAGDFELELTRPPLPDSVIHDMLTYRSTSTVTGGASGTVRANVTAMLTHAGGSLDEFPRDCPIELVAYRAKDRRDSAPRSGAPDWRPTRTCSDAWSRVILNKGESTSFEMSATARDILGSSLPEGLYHFAVVVHTRTRHVWLSAGSAELRR